MEFSVRSPDSEEDQFGWANRFSVRARNPECESGLDESIILQLLGDIGSSRGGEGFQAKRASTADANSLGCGLGAPRRPSFDGQFMDLVPNLTRGARG
jgi:hypothetical protein